MITLQYRASISQETGEDWKGIALTLNTASPLVGSEIPKLGPWTIGTQFPIVPPVTTQAACSAMVPLSRSMDYSQDRSLPVPPIAFEKPSFRSRRVIAKANDGAVSSSFEVEGSSNIPSDGSSHKVSIVVSLACRVLFSVSFSHFCVDFRTIINSAMGNCSKDITLRFPTVPYQKYQQVFANGRLVHLIFIHGV